MQPAQPRATNDLRVWLALAFLLFLMIGALLRSLPPAVPVTYLLASFLSAAVYAYDKAQAQAAGWRIPESTLHAIDFLGGWPGGLVTQVLIRHKNRKRSFQISFWLLVVPHLLFWGWAFAKVPSAPDFFSFARNVARAIRTSWS